MNYICTIAKNEDLYLEEWINYHLLIGFDKICIYDNNDNSRIYKEKYIIDLLVSGLIEIVRWEYNQLSAYINFINTHTYDWVLFIDIDEFFSLGDNNSFNNINEYLNSCKDYNVIILPWRIYDSNGQKYYNNRPVLERFNKEANIKFNWNLIYYYIPNITKSFLSENNKNVKFYNVHVPTGNDCKFTINTLEGSEKYDGYQFINEINYDYPYIKHICFKSYQEFMERMCLPKIDDTVEDHILKYNCKINNFFAINEDLKEINDIIICKQINSHEEYNAFNQDFRKWYNKFINAYKDKINHIHIKVVTYSNYYIQGLPLDLMSLTQTIYLVALDKNSLLQQMNDYIDDDPYILFVDDINNIDCDNLVNKYLNILENDTNIILLNDNVELKDVFYDYIEFYNWVESQTNIINEYTCLIKYSYYLSTDYITNLKDIIPYNEYGIKIYNYNNFFYIDNSNIISLFGENAYYYLLTYVNSIELN